MPRMPWRLNSRRDWRAVIDALDTHPNLAEILAIMERLSTLRDRDLARLAGAWHDSAHLARARNRALAPDAPLILDVLIAFERAEVLISDDSRRDRERLPADDLGRFSADLPDEVLRTALKAIRDALAAAYAWPVLTRAEYLGLLSPWRQVFPSVPAPRGPAPTVAMTEPE